MEGNGVVLKDVEIRDRKITGWEIKENEYKLESVWNGGKNRNRADMRKWGNTFYTVSWNKGK